MRRRASVEGCKIDRLAVHPSRWERKRVGDPAVDGELGGLGGQN